MALSEALKASLKANTEFYKNNKDKPVRPELGLRSTLDTIEFELQRPSISEADKTVLMDWMEAFAQVKIEGDEIAEARRDRIRVDILNLKSETQKQASGSKPSEGDSTTQDTQNSRSEVFVAKGVPEIETQLQDINPENLEKSVAISESFINKLQDGPAKTTLRGIHGAVIYSILRNAGHNMILRNGQVEIIPRNDVYVVDLQEKLQTLINTKRLSLDTIRVGMLYSSPSFAKYAEMKITKDAKGTPLIDPKASSQDFIQYLHDKKTKGDKSADIDAILKSGDMLQGLNMAPIIYGFRDMGQVNAEWAKQDPKVVADAIVRSAQGSTNVPQVSTKQESERPPRTPPKPGTAEYYANIAGTEAGKFGADMGKNAGAVLGGVGNTLGGFIKGAGEGAGPIGAGVAILGLVYAGYKFFTAEVKGHSGFFWSVVLLLGGSGLVAALKRFGIDIPDMSTSDTVDKAKKAAEEAAEKAKKLAGGSGSTDVKKDGEKGGDEKPRDASQYQFDLRKKVEANTSLSQSIDKLASIQGSNYPGKLDDYLKFIETDLKEVPLVKLFPTDHKKSIFFDSFDTDFSVDSKLSGQMLKKVLREYLTGKITLTGNGDKLGEKEKEAFLKTHNITPTDIQNKKLSDILESVHKVRVGGNISTTPEEKNFQDAMKSVNFRYNNADVKVTKIQKVGTQFSAIVDLGNNSVLSISFESTNNGYIVTSPTTNNYMIEDTVIQGKRQISLLPKTNTAPSTATKHKIGNMEIEVGRNVQLKVMTLVYDSDGNEYSNTQSKLPKDVNGKLHIPKDGVVKLGDKVIKVNNIDHVEVEYNAEKVYVALVDLKTI